MICPNNGQKDFDEEYCISCNYYSQCLTHPGFNYQGDNFPTIKHNPEIERIKMICPQCKRTVNGIPKKDKNYWQCAYCKIKLEEIIENNHPNLNKDGNPRTFKVNFITKEEIDKFKIELGEIIYFSDWEKKINDKSN